MLCCDYFCHHCLSAHQVQGPGLSTRHALPHRILPAVLGVRVIPSLLYSLLTVDIHWPGLSRLASGRPGTRTPAAWRHSPCRRLRLLCTFTHALWARPSSQPSAASSGNQGGALGTQALGLTEAAGSRGAQTRASSSTSGISQRNWGSGGAFLLENGAGAKAPRQEHPISLPFGSRSPLLTSLSPILLSTPLSFGRQCLLLQEACPDLG